MNLVYENVVKRRKYLERVIEEFFQEKMDNWIKVKIKALEKTEKKLTESQIQKITIECQEKYNLNNWVPDAINRLRSLAMVTHNPKLTHPDIKTDVKIFSDKKTTLTGLVGSTNNSIERDVFGNAAALDVYAFLCLILSDGNTIFQHLEKGTHVIQDELSIQTMTFSEIKEGFLSLKKAKENSPTSDLLKQVYFPTSANEYHLLSIVTSSGLLFGLKNRINEYRFSEDAKTAKEKKKRNEYYSEGFKEIYGLTQIGFGGTKPQNIGVLNNKNGGSGYLLPSIPPKLSPRKIKLPKIDFFNETLNPYFFSEFFNTLHRILNDKRNSILLREKRDMVLDEIFDQILKVVWSVRLIEQNWSSRVHYQNLKNHHKILLDDQYANIRLTENAWIDDCLVDVSRWVISAYKKLKKSEAVSIGDDEFIFIKSRFESYKEGLI